MQDIPFILSESQQVNSILYNPINVTQRIKYTCIAVSSSYIVLGSTSGSLYLFKREPCTFQQLIPLSEGAVSRVEISPDEKVVALATTRGSVCLVTLKPTIKLVAVSVEHVGERIKSLCWNDNSSELYNGDEIGKVSVMVLSFFTVTGMFQAPACTLMQLESSIVQLSFSAPLLLVSTMTRCYICDTVLEQYKQIGNKARYGEYGACFLKPLLESEKLTKTEEEENVSRKRTFSLNTEGEDSSLNESHFKIFCARPGSRLWEVTTNGIVIKTYQFKEALAIPPLPVYKVTKEIKIETNRSWPSQSLMFSQLSPMNGEFLFSYTPSALFILDPTNASVILWSKEFVNVSEAHVVNDEIYLMTQSGKFHCLTLSLLDSLIVTLYDKKLYEDCLQTSTTFRSRMLKSIVDEESKGDNLDLKSDSHVLKSDHPDSKISEILPLISFLRSKLNQPKKLGCGIVVVNSGTSKNSPEACGSGTLDSFETKREEEENFIYNGVEFTNGDIVERREKKEEKRKMQEEKIEKEKKSESNVHEAMCNLQTELEPLRGLVESLKSCVEEADVEKVLSKVAGMTKDVKRRYEEPEDLKHFFFEVIRAAELQCGKSLLENLPIDLLRTTSATILNEVLRIFLDLNSLNRRECTTCSFHHPSFSRSKEPKFIETGSLLFKKLKTQSDECLRLCDRIPFMWREYLPIYLDNCVDEDSRLRILEGCLQTRDSVVLSILLPKLGEREWTKVDEGLRKIEKGICLSCGDSWGEGEIKMEEFIDWSGVTHDIVKKEGPNATLEFLLKVEKSLKDMKLDKNVYQTIIFAKILEKKGIKYTLDFNRNHSEDAEYMSMCSPKIREELMKSLEKDLEQPVDKRPFCSGPHHWGIRYSPKSSTCPCCTLSLQTPVLLGNNGIALFPCGHAYHVNCMIKKKISRCGLH